jgi:nitrile hydratase
LTEFGTQLDDAVEIKVVDSTADMRYLVLPPRPADTQGISEEQLATLVTRDCMVGVTFPDSPSN